MKRYEMEHLKDIIGENVLISVGIDQYENENGLYNCSNDATEIYDVFFKTQNIPFDSVNSTLLNDGYLLKEEFESTLTEISKTTDRSKQLIFYFSGHGVEIEEEFYFVFSNSDVKNNQSLMSMTDVLTIINMGEAKAKVLLIDACRIGVTNQKSIFDKSFNFQKKYLKMAEGIYIIYSCRSGEYSNNDYNGKGMSVFTYFLKEGLTGKARKYDKHIISMNYLYQYVTEESLTARNSIEGIRQQPCRMSDGCNDIFLGFYDFEDISEKYPNSCRITVENKFDCIPKEKQEKIHFLLNEDEFLNLYKLIQELISNIFKNNNDGVSCYIEISSNTLTIIDNGRQFNPLTDLDKNKNETPLHGNGLKALNTAKAQYRNKITFQYDYDNQFNYFKTAFRNKAFSIDELCKIEILERNFCGTKINIFGICKYYYYYTKKNFCCISMSRDMFSDILTQLPEESKLIIVDYYKDAELKELIENYKNDRLIYFEKQ